MIRRDYTSIARRALVVDPLPDGALPIYNNYEYDICMDQSHAGFGKVRSECTHEECIVQCVLEE